VFQFNDIRIPVRFFYYQALQFPRNLDVDVNTGQTFIPEEVLMAQCEQAIYSLSFDETAIANRLQGVTEDTTSLGNIRVRQNLVSDGTEFSPSALEHLKKFFLKTSSRFGRQ